MEYTKTNWENYPNTTTPLNATNLNKIENQLKALTDAIYPIGSIYMSAVYFDPSEYFGGTWERIQDKFLLSAGTTYTNGATGGNATHYHKTAIGFDTNGAYGWTGTDSGPKYGSEVVTGTTGINISKDADTQAVRIAYTEEVSSMPPYLVVYVWKRTA